MSRRIGKTPMYPQYFDHPGEDRRIAILDGSTIYVEDIGQFTVRDFTNLLDLIFNLDCLTFCPSLLPGYDFKFLPEAVHSPDCEVLATSEGKPLAIRAVRSPSSRWIVPSDMWDRQIDDYFISDMRKLFHLFGVVKPTPGSLGQALLRRNLSQNYLPRHTACNAIAGEFLSLHGHGGRCDTMVNKGYEIESALELDESDAYLAHCLQLQAGTSYWFKNGHTTPFITWFAECDVWIKDELPLGPFPIRSGGKNARIRWPRKRGKYRTFLWKEQAEDARQAGCDIVVKSGVGWKYLHNDLEPFARYMHRSRMAVAGTSIERDVKKVSVSGLGHFGMKSTFHYLTDIDDGVSPVLPDKGGRPLKYYTRIEHDYTRPDMIHWYNYLIMQCARTLYHAALPYAIEGRLLMTNYDALLIVEKDETMRYPEKHTLSSMMCDMGDWRWQRLTNVKILGDRSLKCDQKIVTPGVTHPVQEVSA